MTPENLYAAYDAGKPMGEHTCREWEAELSIPKQTIRDYAREGRTYGGRYTFRMIEKEIPKEAEVKRADLWDLEKFKRSVKIGDRFDYESYRKDFVRGTRITSEKVVVVRKFPHIVKLAGLKNPEREVTMTYTELLKQKKDRAKKRMLTAGR